MTAQSRYGWNVSEPDDDMRDEGRTGDPILAALWQKVSSDWDNDAAHGAFLEQCIRSQNLPYAAGLYRAVVEEKSERSEKAKKKIDAIVIAAMQMMSEAKPPADPRNNRWLGFVAFIISLTLLVWLFKSIVR
jgi:hypothetical protein